MQRPAHLKPPANLSPSPPVPEPEEVTMPPEGDGQFELDPVRYGDWEKKGICWDF
ncbi:DUF1674 domain-containing protein [Sphingomonas sp. 1P06PA]|uniref:DUF1674 domain-containing protein n=1 Tax=Sphingomonas sp. 1P06PA TaxID=554121 RepID=UPI0039A4B687